jgi:hypothetical protein
MRRPVGRKHFATIGHRRFIRSVQEEMTMSKLFTPMGASPSREEADRPREVLQPR